MTIYWHAYVAVKRWVCRVLGHRPMVDWTSHGYEIRYCRRCWRSDLARIEAQL